MVLSITNRNGPSSTKRRQIAFPDLIATLLGFLDANTHSPAERVVISVFLQSVQNAKGSRPIHVLQPFQQFDQIGSQLFIAFLCDNDSAVIPYIFIVL